VGVLEVYRLQRSHHVSGRGEATRPDNASQRVEIWVNSAIPKTPDWVRPHVAIATIVIGENFAASIWLSDTIAVAGLVVAATVCHVLVTRIRMTVLMGGTLRGGPWS
jgi:hypothetical protein